MWNSTRKPRVTLLIIRRPTCEGSSFPSSENSDLLDDWSLPGFLYKIWALIATSLRFGGPWTFRRFPALFGTSKVTIRTRPHTHEYPWTYKGTFKTVHCLGWGRFAHYISRSSESWGSGRTGVYRNPTYSRPTSCMLPLRFKLQVSISTTHAT